MTARMQDLCTIIVFLEELALPHPKIRLAFRDIKIKLKESYTHDTHKYEQISQSLADILDVGNNQ